MSDRDNITLPREVVEEAAESLEWADSQVGGDDCYEDAAKALRAALAAPRPEPVAWLWLNDGIPVNAFLSRGDADDPYWLDKGYSTAPLYTAPPAAAPDNAEALRRDAERYRWLRDNARGRALSVSAICWELDPRKCDAAIDAAMQEDKA